MCRRKSFVTVIKIKYRRMFLHYLISLIWISIRSRVGTLAVDSARSLLYQLGICGFGDLLWFLLADLAELGRAVWGDTSQSYLQLVLQIFFWASAGPHKNLRGLWVFVSDCFPTRCTLHTWVFPRAFICLVLGLNKDAEGNMKVTK